MQQKRKKKERKETVPTIILILICVQSVRLYDYLKWVAEVNRQTLKGPIFLKWLHVPSGPNKNKKAI